MSEESRKRPNRRPAEITGGNRARIRAAIDRLLDRTIDVRARERSYLVADRVHTQGGLRP
jgi:hypothetical protein